MIIGYVRRPPCVVVRFQQLLQRLDFDQNLAVTILIFASLTIVQMVPVHCISRSHRLKTDLRGATFEIFLSETTRPRALISSL